MSNKKLLNESTVRRFMGLANLAPLSESFLESQVSEEEVNEEEVKEGDEVVKEADSVEEAETVEEGGTAKRTENAAKGPERGMNLTDRVHEGEDAVEEADAKNENLRIAEDDEEDEEWGGNKGDESETDPGHLDYEGGDEEVAMDADIEDMAADAEAGADEGDLATRAKAILDDLAALLNQATGTEMVTVSDTEEEAGMEEPLPEPMAGGEEEVMIDDEEEVEMAEAKVAEGGAKKGDQSKSREDYEGTNESKKKKSSVDALVAEITSKVISRLNK